MKLKDLIPEYTFDMDAYRARLKAFNKDFKKFLKGKKLGSMPVINIKVEQDGMITFSTKIDELQLDWMISDQSTNQKIIYEISISSPNKRGVFSKKVSGRNANPIDVWRIIEQIYNGKYSR